MLKKDKSNQFDNQFYDLYKNGYLTEKSYLIGREYHTIFVCGQTHQVLRYHKPLILFLNYQYFSVMILRNILSLPNFYLLKLKVDLQQKSGQLIARFKQLHFDYTFLVQIH